METVMMINNKQSYLIIYLAKDICSPSSCSPRLSSGSNISNTGGICDCNVVVDAMWSSFNILHVEPTKKKKLLYEMSLLYTTRLLN